MRTHIVHEQADSLVYEIRQIVILAKRIGAAGVPLTWENIGDPVAKGEPVPDWIIEHLGAVSRIQKSWGYSPSKGMDETREFLAAGLNARGAVQITPEDIYMYNGLGDAVSKMYGYLNRQARVLVPSPSYSIHSTHEGYHANAAPLIYHLDPARGWLPDPDEIRRLVDQHPEVCAVLLINPDNPTGSVWPRGMVEAVVEIARQNDLFVIADEIYNRLTYNGRTATLLADVIGEVPGMALKGISKEYPWPGGRCGWIEVYNEDRDREFKRYVRTLFDAKMVEVCATTQPQMTIPRVFSDERYPKHLEARCAAYEKRSSQFAAAFEGLEGVHAVRPDGAFYASVIFDSGRLNGKQKLKVKNSGAKSVLDEALAAGNVRADKRLVLNILAATGICVVPMSGFTSQLDGFRMTLLEQEDSKRAATLATLRKAIEDYLASA
ncbi:pyridoxal phosphate-dependent aminotransferase [bacterium]|nr:pyridoxal phosphate-dependent aminotransferase [bacterium]